MRKSEFMPRNFRGFVLRVTKSAPLMLWCWACVSGAEPLPAEYSSAYRMAQQWNDQPSLSTDLVAFSLIGAPYHPPPQGAKCCGVLPEYEEEYRQIWYHVPRNYLVLMDKWDGGPQTLVMFKVTFPGFEALTVKNQACMSLPAAYRPPGCRPLEFTIRRGGAYEPPDDVLFNNARKLFHSQQPLPGPYGFELYETGPVEARINTYRKKTPTHTLVIQCLMRRPGDQHPATCNTTSRLESGNVLGYHLYSDQLEHAEEIDDGIERLITRFRLQAEQK